MTRFATGLIAWQRRAGRRDLPWQNTRDPYRIWLSEVMLQQTQVATVIPYFERFIAAFPDVASLAAAPVERVLEQWSGLGYYRRAHMLHRAAQAIVAEHDGIFPCEAAAIAALPGIGRSTAAAIAAFAFGARGAILDGNVKRVLARHAGIDGSPSDPAVERALWARAEALLPARDIETYTQALMDLGAAVCLRTRPRCDVCPIAADCVARREHRIAELPGRRAKKKRCRSVQPLCCCSNGTAKCCWSAGRTSASGRVCGACRSSSQAPTRLRIAARALLPMLCPAPRCRRSSTASPTSG